MVRHWQVVLPPTNPSAPQRPAQTAAKVPLAGLDWRCAPGACHSRFRASSVAVRVETQIAALRVRAGAPIDGGACGAHRRDRRRRRKHCHCRGRYHGGRGRHHPHRRRGRRGVAVILVRGCFPAVEDGALARGSVSLRLTWTSLRAPHRAENPVVSAASEEPLGVVAVAAGRGDGGGGKAVRVQKSQGPVGSRSQSRRASCCCTSRKGAWRDGRGVRCCVATVNLRRRLRTPRPTVIVRKRVPPSTTTLSPVML